MEIINAHAHIYPEKIAAKATDTIGIFYDIKMQMPAGTAERLIEDGKEAGITRFVVHSVATTAHQVRSINEFIKREVMAHPEFIGFITIESGKCRRVNLYLVFLFGTPFGIYYIFANVMLGLTETFMPF